MNTLEGVAQEAVKNADTAIKLAAKFQKDYFDLNQQFQKLVLERYDFLEFVGTMSKACGVSLEDPATDERQKQFLRGYFEAIRQIVEKMKVGGTA